MKNKIEKDSKIGKVAISNQKKNKKNSLGKVSSVGSREAPEKRS